MNQYLLATYGGGNGPSEPPPPEQMQQMMQGIMALEAEMEQAGAFTFGGGLHGVDAATVVRQGESGPMMTDGPYVESKEHIAGFYVVAAADLDDALRWADKVSATIGRPIEVRPFAATGKVADNMPG